MYFQVVQLKSHQLKTLAVCLIVVLLSACKTIATPALKADVPTQWRNISNSQLDYSASTKEAKKLEWWLILKDPILDETMALALKQNLTLAQALARLNIAKSTEKAIIAAQYPQIDFSAGPDSLARTLSGGIGNNAQTSQTPLRTTGAFIAGFDLIWELPLFGRAEAQRKIAQAGLNNAVADIASTKINISAEVARAYAELRAAHNKIVLLDNQQQQQETLKSLMIKGEKAGLFSANNQDTARTAMIEIRNQASLVNLQKEAAIQRLMVLCGITTPLAAWLNLPSESWDLNHEGKLNPSLPADLIRSRTDVSRAEALVLQAAGEAGIAHADLYPRLSIEGALMLGGDLTDVGRDSRKKARIKSQNVALLAPTIRIPLLDWGLNRAIANAKDAKLNESVLAYQETVLLAIEDTENSLANYQASNKRLIRALEDVDYVAEKSTKIQTAFKAGYLSKPDVILANIKSQDTAFQLIDAKVAWLSDFANANKALASMKDIQIEQLSVK